MTREMTASASTKQAPGGRAGWGVLLPEAQYVKRLHGAIANTIHTSIPTINIARYSTTKNIRKKNKKKTQD